jgi:hypothetical protein
MRYLLFSLLTLISTSVIAQAKGPGLDSVSTEVKGAAVGHYNRSRSLIIAAINEFDRGYKVANPDMLIDSAKLRQCLLDAAAELEKVTSPQGRETKGGVKYDADSRLLNEAIK